MIEELKIEIYSSHAKKRKLQKKLLLIVKDELCLIFLGAINGNTCENSFWELTIVSSFNYKADLHIELSTSGGEQINALFR